MNRNLRLKPNGLFLPTQKIGQRTPWALTPVDHELAVADHVHQLNAGEYDASGSARFQVEHRAGHRLDGAMILLEDVLEELNLHHKERHVAAGVDCIHGRVVGSAFVHRDFVWIAVRSDCLVEKALRCGHVALVRQQEVEGLRCLSMKSCRSSC